MKAVVWTRYGPPEGLQLMEVPDPVPDDHEVLVRIMATTVTAGDCEMRSLRLPMMLSFPMRLYNGIRRPKRLTILGQELAGEVVATGKRVTRFRPGDHVFGATDIRQGTYAEFKLLSEKSREAILIQKPAGLSFNEAATIPVGGLEALHFLRRAEIQPGQEVLINGAGGSIGTMAVQLAKHQGAIVTAVDRGEKLKMLQELGADQTIDFSREDFTRSGKQYHVIFDIVGKTPFSRTKRVLKEKGFYLISNPNLRYMAGAIWTNLAGANKVIAWASARQREDLVYLKELIESGHLRTVIDRTFPLEKVSEAHRYVESGAKKGHVVIRVAPEEPDESEV